MEQEARKEHRMGVVMDRYHNQFCVASVFSASCERLTGGIDRDRTLWAFYIKVRIRDVTL